MEILKGENIVKEYGYDENKIKVLDNINFTVNKGEFIVIIGKSGSGKSTLMNIMSGLELPTNGNVLFDNKNIFQLSKSERTLLRRDSVGLVFQSFNLIPVLTVKENIMLPTLNRKNIDENYIEGLINMLELGNKKDNIPNQLSGGQQQRVAIARALVNKPLVIFADEPTGNLDSKTENEVMKLLKNCQLNYEQTIIMITHNIDLTKYADRVIKIEDGSIVEDVKI